MPIDFPLTANSSTTLSSAEDLLKIVGKDKLYRVYLDKYREMGMLSSPGNEKQFFTEMFSIGPFDGNWLVFASAAKRAKKPIRREITKLVRFLGNDGKEYIRYAATFYSENKHGEEISTHYSGLGLWEEPVFRKEYSKEFEDFMDTLSIKKTIPHYECPWPSAIKELEKDFIPETKFMIQDESRKYTVRDKQEWYTQSREVLVNRERGKMSQDPNKLLGELVDTLRKSKGD